MGYLDVIAGTVGFISTAVLFYQFFLERKDEIVQNKEFENGTEL